MKIGFPCSWLIIAFCSTFLLDASTSPLNIQDNGNEQLESSDPKSKNFDVFASFLIWTAREAGTDCWAEVLTTTGSASSNVLEPVHFGWDPGYQVGIGYGKNRSQWNTQAYYTWFYTRAADAVASTPGSVHSTFMGNFYVDNPQGGGISGPAYQRASIDWDIRFNMFDWELGRNFCIGQALALRPFLGVKGGWIHQTIQTKWYNPDLSAPPFLGSPYYSVGIEKLHNNFWGLGPQAGINTKWYLVAKQNRLFYLISDFSGAMMWGHWSFGDVFENTIQQQVLVDFAPLNSGASMLRSFMGLGWETSFPQNQFHLSLKVGYETQFWLDQLQFYSFVAGRFANALTLQGGTFEFCLDY